MADNKTLLIFAVALVYFITARLGLLLALPPGFASAFWPPSGIAVAALLIFGSSIWPGILLGSIFANLFTTVGDLHTSIFVSSGIAIGSILQPLAIWYFLKILTTCIPHLLSTRRNIISFLIFTAICCTISPTISLGILYSEGVIPWGSLGTNWLTWWLGDTIGIYVFTPLLFSWAKPQELKQVSEKRFEFSLLFLITLLISIICFGGWLPKGYPIEYTLMPTLIWASIRFPPQIATTLLVLISVIAIVGTAYGYGPFIQSSRNESLLLLQAFIGVITATTLILISAINEIWHAQQVQEKYSQELKTKVMNLEEKK